MKAIELLKKEMIEGIESVLSGDVKAFESKNITPAMVQDYLESAGWVRGDLDTNGWQYDWWLKFTKDGESVTAYGGGYYGDFGFRRTEEEDEE